VPLDHLLEVVEQKQQLTFTDVLGETVLRSERLADRLGDERRIAQWSEPNPEHARLELRHELRRGLERKAGLARAARAGEREQAGAVLQQRRNVLHFLVPADERAGGAWQVRVRDRLERREALGTELEDPDRLLEVLQAVLAEICQVNFRELACLLREQHLAPVSDRRDARALVHVLPDVALLAEVGSAGV